MRVLDCSSLSTTYASLEPLLEMNQSQIRAKLKEYSIDDFLGRYAGRTPSSFRELVLQHVTGGAPIRFPDLVIWFHATRVPPGTSFSEGLHTLPQRAEIIKAFLKSLIPSCLGSGFMPPSETSSWVQQGWRQHGWKLSQHIDWGPDAFLVRDAIFERDDSFHDYLATPEVIEDLALILAGDRWSELVGCFRDVTQPCIVKFRSARPRSDTVAVALYYSYSAEWGLGIDVDASTCYSGDGEAIPPQDILDVEFPSGKR
jgi:hypothetical protein